MIILTKEELNCILDELQEHKGVLEDILVDEGPNCPDRLELEAESTELTRLMNIIAGLEVNKPIDHKLTKREKELLLGMFKESAPVLNEAISECGPTHELYEAWVELRDLEAGIIKKLEASPDGELVVG